MVMNKNALSPVTSLNHVCPTDLQGVFCPNFVGGTLFCPGSQTGSLHQGPASRELRRSVRNCFMLLPLNRQVDPFPWCSTSCSNNFGWFRSSGRQRMVVYKHP